MIRPVKLLPKIGAPFRTQDENQIFTEVEQQLAQDGTEINWAVIMDIRHDIENMKSQILKRWAGCSN